MRKIQDHYFKKAQKEGYPARSIYKLAEAQKKYRLLRPGARVIDIGCRPGSWALYAAKIVGPGGLVVGVDICPCPPLHVTGGARITVLQADAMCDGIIPLVQGHCRRFDVLISDIAPQTTGSKWADQQQSLLLSQRVLALTGPLLQPGGNFICKVFEGEDFRQLVQEARRMFKMVKVFKPDSSRKESREVFILGLQFQPPPALSDSESLQGV
ncbi:MAG: RlmE family RNA methyltransferase [Thermodesulfobacteriota bacterium]